MNIHEEIHDGHLIRANAKGAMVYIDGSKNLEAKFSAGSQDDAVAQAKSWIDTKTTERKAERRAGNIGTVEGYAEALSLTKLSKARRLMLVAHRRADDRSMTPAELAAAAGWKTSTSVGTHYATLGKDVAQRLDLDVGGDSKDAWTSALVVQDAETGALQMHEEVALAMDQLKIG